MLSSPPSGAQCEICGLELLGLIWIVFFCQGDKGREKQREEWKCGCGRSTYQTAFTPGIQTDCTNFQPQGEKLVDSFFFLTISLSVLWLFVSLWGCRQREEVVMTESLLCLSVVGLRKSCSALTNLTELVTVSYTNAEDLCWWKFNGHSWYYSIFFFFSTNPT